MSATKTSGVINWQKFDGVTLVRDPFDYLVVPGFLHRDVANIAAACFPGPDVPGVLPAPTMLKDEPFSAVLGALQAPDTTDAFARKFDVSLDNEALMVTLRARTRLTDGRIHNDSANKVVTALIYLNDAWPNAGGQLRLLRGPDDIDDMIAEVRPLAGTLIAFRRSGNSWHGHKPFEGPRRAIMLNWMVDRRTARLELRRHAITAGIKSLFTTH